MTHDVAVVGAGFAGVTAARDLGARGHSVVLLEARERIGGRAFTGEAFGRSVDLGGAYVHWTQPHVWSEVTRYGIELATPMEINKVRWLAGGVVRSGTPLDYDNASGPLLARCLADARVRFPRPFDLTAADTATIEHETLADRLDALDLSPYERDVLDAAMSALVCSDREQGLAQFLLWTATSFGSWNAFLEVAGQWPIAGGTGRLLDAIHADSTAELRLSTPATAIEDDGSAVLVTTGDGERIRARHAVVAVPLNTSPT